MKNESKKKIKNFTIEVIDFFLAIPEAFVRGFDRKEFYGLMRKQNVENNLTCSNISQLISSFKRRGYIEVKKSDGQESIIFTNKARLSLVDKIAERSTADKLFRFVSFDIPERLRLNRDQFRRVIKRLGFRQIQKSLWVCDKNIGDIVELAACEYRVEDYVVYIVSQNTNIDGTIKGMMKQ